MKQPKYIALLKGQERNDRLVNCLEVKLRVMDELHFIDAWHQRNNLLISGIEDHPQVSYFDSQHTTHQPFHHRMTLTVLKKGTVHPCTGTEALYRLDGPQGQ
jgi:hypothetical protein